MTAQNVIFTFIGQAPSLFVSRLFGASTLGQYSRAVSLTLMPASALSTALNRAVQPYWRHIDSEASATRAVRDAFLMGLGVIMPMFVVLAAAGPYLAFIWLGPGWRLAGVLAAPLALGYGMQAVFLILTSGAEMRAEFRNVRAAQFCSAAVLFASFAAAFGMHSVEVACWGFAASQSVGTLVLVLRFLWHDRAVAIDLGRSAIGLCVLLSCIYLTSAGAAAFAGHIAIEGSYKTSLIKTVAVTLAGLLVWAVGFRFTGVPALLAERGVHLPRILRRMRQGSPAAAKAERGTSRL